MNDFSAVPQALYLAVRQLTDLKFIKVLVLSVALAFIVTGPFYLVFLAMASLLEWILPASLSLPWLGEVRFLGVFTIGLASKTTWVFWTYIMSPFAAAIIGIFLENIVDAVETRHFPHLPTVRHRSLLQMVGYSLRFLLLMLAVSLAALIVSFFSGIFAPLIFIVANGYLIGREYYEMVALRRQPPEKIDALTRQSLPTLWLLGSALALALSVPFLNLIVPIVGVAAITHLYHNLNNS